MTSFAQLPDPASPLSRQSAAQAFADILDGRTTEEAIAEFLVALSIRGESSLEIAEAAHALRERLIPITAPAGAIDVCGTGGDGQHTLNVSTAVSLVVAACGAHYNDQLMHGSVYVYTRIDGAWTQTQQLVAADGDVGDVGVEAEGTDQPWQVRVINSPSRRTA